jgi:hypothetical protein
MPPVSNGCKFSLLPDLILLVAAAVAEAKSRAKRIPRQPESQFHFAKMEFDGILSKSLFGELVDAHRDIAQPELGSF